MYIIVDVAGAMSECGCEVH